MKQRTRITWLVQSVEIVSEKRNVKVFNQHEEQNEIALPLLLSVGMLNGRFNQHKRTSAFSCVQEVSVCSFIKSLIKVIP